MAQVDAGALLDDILSIISRDVEKVASRSGDGLTDDDADRLADYVRAVSGVERGRPKRKRELDHERLLEEASNIPELQDLIRRKERGTHDQGDDE